MKNYSFFKTLLMFILVAPSFATIADDENDNAPDGTSSTDEETEQVANEAKDVISRINALVGVDDKVKELFVDIITPIAQQKRTDADLVWQASRNIDRAMDALIPRDGLTQREIDSFVKKLRRITKEMRRISYTDRFHSNQELSYQIKTRLIALVDDASKIVEPKNASNGYYREDFLEELELLGGRYVSTARFSAGIGISMNYVPTISYQENSSLDLSPFQNDVMGGADRIFFEGEFANQSFIAASVVVDTPYFRVQALFPSYEESFSTSSPVRQRELNGVEDALVYRTTTASELDIDYDISVTFSFLDFMSLSGLDYPSQQIDFGFGAGFTGLEIRSTISHDVRIANGDSRPYRDLPSTQVIETTSKNSYLARYLKIYYDMVFADEYVFALSGKYYLDETEDDTEIEVDGYMLSFDFHWYPTFLN